LFEEVLLEGFLFDDRLEEELAPVLFQTGDTAVSRILGHVVPPFLVQLRQLLKFLPKLLLLLPPILRRRLDRFLLQGRIGLHFLLNQISQLQHGSLQNLQALLQLRSQNLLLGQGLCLRKSGHAPPP
jgi:hypothetical protein